MTLIAGGIKGIAIKLPPAHKIGVAGFAGARQNQAQHQNKKKKLDKSIS